MALFYLHVVTDGKIERDPHGSEFADLRLAVAEAGRAAGHVLHDELHEQVRVCEVRVIVTDADGRERATVTARCTPSD